MAFDGFTVACLAREIKENLIDARIAKIVQTESDELIFTLKCAHDTPRGRQLKLLMSAQAQLPMIRFTTETKNAPLNAPSFCMLLRKHLENGKIISVEQPSLERVLRIGVTHFNEMGDLKTLTLIIELMGKHSNIILINDENVILDSIKHVSANVSSVREVLPGREYFLPDTRHKRNPLEVGDVVTFSDIITHVKSTDIQGAIVECFTGFSNTLASELCFRASVDASSYAKSLPYCDMKSLTDELVKLMDTVRAGEFTPCAYYENTKAGAAAEFAAVRLFFYERAIKPCDGKSVSKAKTVQPQGAENGLSVSDAHGTENMYTVKCYDDMSSLLESFYRQKSVQTRIRDKSQDLRHIVRALLSRTASKYDKQLLQLKDTEKRDKFLLRGELLNAYAHEIKAGEKQAKVLDYHTGKEVVIPLDENLSATENAQKYFERYARMKRTYETLSVLTKEVKEELDYLESVNMALTLATDEEELAQIRRELAEAGYLKDKGSRNEKAASGKSVAGRGSKAYAGGKARGKEKARGAKGEASEAKSSPLHFVTSDGFDVFVGKNNYQNDALTFHSQGKDDWWFHAKKIPGSHVVLKGNGSEIPDRAFEEAAALAAHFSTGASSEKVEVDYVERKNVKKPGGSKPGYVVYYTNYSMIAGTDISEIKQIE